MTDGEANEGDSAAGIGSEEGPSRATVSQKDGSDRNSLLTPEPFEVPEPFGLEDLEACPVKPIEALRATIFTVPYDQKAAAKALAVVERWLRPGPPLLATCELGARVSAARSSGRRLVDVAKELGVSISTAQRAEKSYERAGGP